MFAQLFFAPLAFAASPEGLWQTSHPLTGLPRAEIRLEIKDGVLSGKIERVLLSSDQQYSTCDWCTGHLKNTAFLGMIILDGLRQSSSSPHIWSGGQVLDPDSGRIYKARIRLEADGRSLQLRGYSGSEFFGKNETWLRLASPR